MAGTGLDVSIRLYDAKEGATRAFASLTTADGWAIHGIRVSEGRSGLFVAMPQEKGHDKAGKEKYYDVAHPTTAGGRAAVSKAVLAAYEEAAAKREKGDELAR